MRLLVTGASGLIGRAVAQAALAAGHRVSVAGRRRPPDLPEDVAFVQADLSRAEEAEAAVRATAPSHIVHAAWETRKPTYWEDPVNLDWVVATAKMAGAFGDVGGERFVQIGSCAEYDWTAYDVSRRRDRPATRYGKAKLAAFRAVETAAHDRFAAVEARIFSVYGPLENRDRFIPLLCRSYAAGETPALGSGVQERDILHVEDAARAILLLLGNNAPQGSVDIGSGECVALSEVATILATLAGVNKTGLGARPDLPDDPPRLAADARSLRATGWIPEVGLAGGLERTFAWWLQQE